MRVSLFCVKQRRLVASYRRFGTTYQSHLQSSSSPRQCWNLEDGTDRLYRNVGNQLPIWAVSQPRRAMISTISFSKRIPCHGIGLVSYLVGYLVKSDIPDTFRMFGVCLVPTFIIDLFPLTKPIKCTYNIRSSIALYHSNMFRHYSAIFRTFFHQVLKFLLVSKTWCKNAPNLAQKCRNKLVGAICDCTVVCAFGWLSKRK